MTSNRGALADCFRLKTDYNTYTKKQGHYKMKIIKKINKAVKYYKKHHIGRKINNTIQKTARIAGTVAPIAAMTIPGALPAAGAVMAGAAGASAISNAIYKSSKNPKKKSNVIKRQAI